MLKVKPTKKALDFVNNDLPSFLFVLCANMGFTRDAFKFDEQLKNDCQVDFVRLQQLVKDAYIEGYKQGQKSKEIKK